MAGFRPNHLGLASQFENALEFDCQLAVTEITGSETFVHLDHDISRWVGVVHGVQNLTIGTAIKAYVDPTHIYVFNEDGALVAPAAYTLAA